MCKIIYKLNLCVAIIAFVVALPLIADASYYHFKFDVNGDGCINLTDASEILTAYANIGAGVIDPNNLKSYDVDNNGLINLSDASTVLQYYANNGAQYFSSLHFDNAIFLPTHWSGEPIPLEILPATQENVDQYNIVQDSIDDENDTTFFSKPGDLFIFGHMYLDLGYIRELVLQDEITLWNNSIPTTYTVVRSELGYFDPIANDIMGLDGQSLLYSNYENNVIRLITCASFLNPSLRWVVIAEEF